MRTTLTLDEDVAIQLERVQRDRGTSFKQVVNEAIRHGLREMTRTPRRRHLHRTRTVSLGRCLIGSLDDVAGVLAVAEGSTAVILVDANLLVYAHASSLAQHGLAHAWLDEKLNGAARVGLPWPSLVGFVRLVSNPRIFQHAVTVSDAWRQVEEWLSCASVWIPSPTERHSAVLGNILSTQPMKSDLVPDAHLAALAIEHGLILCSTDGDFARFSGLNWNNPLAPGEQP